MHVFYKPVDRYLDTDELYPNLTNYEGRVEFAMFSKKNFDLSENGETPELTFQSDTGPNDLPPINPDTPFQYQEVHPMLEGWAVYRLLPQLLKYDRTWIEFMTNVHKGMAVCPSYEKQRNQPSLWTYYETLPDWCRDNGLVRQTLFAFEYNKPHLDIR